MGDVELTCFSLVTPKHPIRCVGLEAMAAAGSVGYLEVPLKSNGAR